MKGRERSVPTLGAERARAFARDGVVLVERAVPSEWLDQLDGVVADALRAPSRWASDSGVGADDGRGRVFEERYLWRDHPIVRRFALESGIASLVGEALASRTLRFYFDHWFVKEPGAGTGTPWHQDAPYWPFSGRQIASAWIALTDVTAKTAPLELVNGSHLWDKRYRPKRFVESDPTDDWVSGATDGEDAPDIDSNRSAYDIVSVPMRRGDALLFSAWTLHAAPANASPSRRIAMSTRWLGDDVRWRPHAGADPTVRPEEVPLEPWDLVTDDDHFPVAWSRDV